MVPTEKHFVVSNLDSEAKEQLSAQLEVVSAQLEVWLSMQLAELHVGALLARHRHRLQ